ncbi:MAG TPA: hypothetical protein VEM40_12525 [Nitrospirota bacterium]|nr:hypothetical protein [Nitrospirota bacterium]
MQILRIIIGTVVLISGVFFVVSGPLDTVHSPVRIAAIGVILIGGVIFFLMQLVDSQKPNVEAQKPKKNNSQKPIAKEDELIQYIHSNVLMSNTCSTSRYNTKNINLEDLIQDISDFYERNFKWLKPIRIEFDNIISLVNDDSIVVLIKGVNNVVVKVHVPVEESDVKTELVGVAQSASGNTFGDDLIVGESSGRINPGLALKKASRGRNTTADALKQQRHRLEESIAKYIDDHLRNNQPSQKNEPLDMMYLRNLRNWRT